MEDQVLINKLNEVRAGRDIRSNDLISIDDLSNEEIELIYELAAVMEGFLKGDMKKIPLMKGRSQLNFFMENSTRTRVSFELAGKNLSADTINIASSASSMKKGETLLDTAVTMDQMQPDVIVMRTNYSGGVRFFARNVKAAVINAGDGWNEHPTQALLDLYTMMKFVDKDLKGKKIVIVGDVYHSRVFGSMVRLLQRYGLEVVVTAPYTLVRPDMEQWGVTHVPNIEDALPGADIVYVLRLQTERAAAAFVPTLREYSKTYVINANRMKLAKPGAVVMHAGPVIRELDVHTNILETDVSLVPEQVFSGYCVRAALLWLMSDKRKNKTVKPRLFKA
jgi:aspartate carbamoyltransferase catalytic subunit